MQTFFWMLIHSLWQGLLFTIITGIVMVCTRKSSAALRYNILTVLFFLFIGICITTFIWQFNNPGQETIQQQINGIGVFDSNSLQAILQNFTDYFTANAPVMMMAWFVIFLFKCVKMVAGFVYIQRIKYHKTQQPPVSWKDKVAILCEQLQVKRGVLLLESGIVKIPVVIGHLKPIILIPVGLLTNLPAGEVEAVLLHELAHIRRNDYFVNMIQVIAENIFFFNPALLWMSALLREERENCCDDVAVLHTKNKKQLIQALISFKEHALHTSEYAVAFPAKKHQLLHRVTRMINNRNKTLNPAEKIFFVASFILLMILSVAVADNNVPSAIQPQAYIDKKELKQNLDADASANTTITIDDVKQYTINEKTALAKDALVKQKFLPDTKEKHTSFKPQPFEYYSKSVTVYNSEADTRDQNEIKEPAYQLMAEQKQAALDMIQAQKDMQQAKEDEKQAALDHIQAQKDQEQALKDMKQAEMDKQQYLADRQVALKEKLKPLPPKN
ncbi:MAG: M56 family metallopeptidase [Panacibacter sp.]